MRAEFVEPVGQNTNWSENINTVMYQNITDLMYLDNTTASRGGATIRSLGVPTFSNFSVFTVLTPTFQCIAPPPPSNLWRRLSLQDQNLDNQEWDLGSQDRDLDDHHQDRDLFLYDHGTKEAQFTCVFNNYLNNWSLLNLNDTPTRSDVRSIKFLL